MEGLIRGQPESEAAAAAAGIIIAAGGAFQRVAAHHGSDSEQFTWSNALYGYTTDAPRAGEMVRGWVYGPIAKGYWVDPGRSAVCGNQPTAEQREAIESCLALVDVIIGAVRVGSTAREATLTIEAAAKDTGYFTDSALFFETYGHGLGTFFSHPSLLPRLTADSRVPSQMVDEPFRSGQVMTAEAFLRRPGVGTATFEDVFIVTDGDPEMLTTTPRVFW
jgi:Xaa-Pro aminopeptidase